MDHALKVIIWSLISAIKMKLIIKYKNNKNKLSLNHNHSSNPKTKMITKRNLSKKSWINTLKNM